MTTRQSIKLLKTDKTESSVGSFVRKEDKFLLTKEQADILILLLKTNLENASPFPDTDYTIVESVYYDNANLDILTEYLKRSSSRSKMRARRYAPNGVWGSDIFIEVKAKENGICNKSRFKISINEMVDLSLGKELTKTAGLRYANSSLKNSSLIKRMQLVNNFIKKLKTLPSSKITYSRLAYERDGFRVTLDQDLKFSNLLLTNESVIRSLKTNTAFREIMMDTQKAYVQNQVVLEVKHTGNIPEWMQNFLRENKVEEASFSKYCYAMSHSVVGSLISTDLNKVKDNFAG